MSPAGKPRTFSSASRTPGTNASRDVVSCRIVSVSPWSAEDDLLMSHEARQSHRVDLRVGSHPGGGRFGGARRRIALGVVVELHDLGAREHLRRLLGETHHEDGSLREVRRVEARDTGLVRCCVHGCAVEARSPDHDGHGGCEAPLDVGSDGLGPGEVHRRVTALGDRRAFRR